MKKLLLLLTLLLILSSNSYSQFFFRPLSRLSIGKKFFALYVIELSNRNILVTSDNSDSNSTEVSMLSPYGEEIKKTVVDFTVKAIAEINTDTLILFGSKYMDTTYSQIYCQLLDFNFNTINIDTLGIHNILLSNASLHVSDDKIYFDISYLKSLYSNQGEKVIAGIIDRKGFYTKYLSFSISQVIRKIIQAPSGDVHFCVRDGYYVFDSILNYKYYNYDQDNGGYNHDDMIFFEDSTLLKAETSLIDGKYRIRVKKFTNDFKILKRLTFDSPYIGNYAGIYSSIAKTENGVFIAGTQNPSYFAVPDDTVNSYIFVARLDNTLKKVWEKTIGGDALYMVYSVCPAQDDGFIVACTRYDENNPEYNVDVLILKINAVGQYSFVKQIECNSGIPVFYPNPVKDFINVEFNLKMTSNVNLSIYSSDGNKIRTLINETLVKGSHSYTEDLTMLPNGVYICESKLGNKVSFSKIIINRE